MEHSHARHPGQNLFQKFQLFAAELWRNSRQPRNIAPRTCEALNKTICNRISILRHDDRNRQRRRLGRSSRVPTRRDDDIDL